MKKIILIMTLFGFISCSPKNPYYKNHLSDLPYNIFFEAKQEHNDYIINGKLTSNNILSYSLPDTINGGFDSGNCVAEVELNGSNQIMNINIIGMTLFKKQTNKITGFDRYAATNKRINYKINAKFAHYVHFVRELIRKLKFTNRDNLKNDIGKAYVKLFFHKKNI